MTTLVERLNGLTEQFAEWQRMGDDDWGNEERTCREAAARLAELEDQRPTFCSHIAVPWNGHHEESCYTRPPADPPDRTFRGQTGDSE